MNDKLDYSALGQLRAKPSNYLITGVILTVFLVIAAITAIVIFLPPQAVETIANLMLVLFVLFGIPLLFVLVLRHRNLSLPARELALFSQANSFIFKNCMRGLLGRAEPLVSDSALLTGRPFRESMRQWRGLKPKLNFSIAGDYAGVHFEVATITQRFYPTTPYGIDRVFYGLVTVNDARLEKLPPFVISPETLDNYYLNDDTVRSSSWRQGMMPDASYAYMAQEPEASATADALLPLLPTFRIDTDAVVEHKDGSLYIIIPDGLPLNEQGLRRVFGYIESLVGSLNDL